MGAEADSGVVWMRVARAQRRNPASDVGLTRAAQGDDVNTTQASNTMYQGDAFPGPMDKSAVSKKII
jgi:hypothetical protein